MAHKTLQQTVSEMKRLANRLAPYSHPRVEFSDEQDIVMLKQRSITVDGYDMVVCYSVSEYPKFMLESLQMQSTSAPYLPFTVVCKLGRAFLGSRNLSYCEFYRNNRKVYCWTLRSRNGRPLPPDQEYSQAGSYEGFEFSILEPGTVDLL